MSGIGTQFMEPVLQNQEYNQREATLPAELAQKAASTRYTAALADRVEQESAADKNVAAQLSQMAGVSPQGGGNGSVSSRLNSMSEMYAKAGQPGKAAQLAMQASQAAAHEATVTQKQVQEAASQAKLAGEQFKMASGLLSGVKDQDSWETANGLFEKQTGQPSPFKNIPYDPKIVKVLQDASETAYQKHLVELRQQAVAAQVANVKSAIESRATRDNVALERLRVTNQREARLAKTGGKDIGAPNKAEMTAADKLLGDTGLEGDERDAAAFSIASEARVLRRKNPGISADEALRQAALSAKQNGSITPGVHHMLARNEPAKFSSPISVPASGKAADLVDGQLYKDAQGKTAIWDAKAKGWKPAGKATAGKATAPVSSGSSDGEDPEGDDNE